MSHELIRLTSKLYNTPHLVEEHYLNSVMTYLNDRNLNKIEMAVEKKVKSTKELAYNPDTKVGVLAIQGPLTYLQHDAVCSEPAVSYSQLQNEFDMMIKAGAETIVLDVDSPGGEAYGMYELGRYLRSEADKNNIQLISYVDGLAASAGYGLASAAHKIIANPMAEVGSVGVVVKLRNSNKAMQKMGVEDTYIYAGKSKIPFDAEGGFTESFLSDIQEKVDSLYSSFVSYVADMRGISVESVKNTEAKTFLVDKALELGLVDEVMSREQFFTYLADVVQKEEKMLGSHKLFKTSKVEETFDMNELTELTAKLEGVQTLLADAEVAKEAALSELTSKVAELSVAVEKIASLEAVVAQADASEATRKTEARKQRLSQVVPADKVEALMSTVGVLDEASFEAIATTFEAQAKVEKENVLFKEIGVDGEADSTKEDATTKLIKAKYKN
jgi:signal peptide peptidase SppA